MEQNVRMYENEPLNYALEVNDPSGKVIGEGTFHFDPSRNMYCLFHIDIDTDAQRQGYGLRILQEMVKKIGPNKQVYMPISHKPSVQLAYDQFGQAARQQGTVDLPTELVQQLPIVSFLKKGNVTVTHGSLIYIPEEDNPEYRDQHPLMPFDIELQGVTGEE